jgi:site-specific DNA recombinase
VGKKVTRHNHLYRGLFRCGLCDGPMIPERQKGHVYYRCQKPDCETKTVREEQIDNAVQTAFRSLEISLEQAHELQRKWTAWIDGDERANQIQYIELRLAETSSRLERLTDLLIDGTISKEDFETRKRGLNTDLARLREERQDATESVHTPQQMEELLERMKSLAALHRNGNPLEKREMVENAFSNRRVVGKNVELEPYSWLEHRDSASGVSYGEQHRHTYRTIEKLLGLFNRKANDDSISLGMN